MSPINRDNKKRLTILLLNTFENDSRVHKESWSLGSLFDTQILALARPGLKIQEQNSRYSVYRIALKTKKLPNNCIFKFIKYLELTLKVLLLTKNSSIIHANDLITLPLACLIKLVYRIPVVYDSHEYAINDAPFEAKFSMWKKYMVERTFIRFADHVINVSPSIAQKYSELYSIPKPTVVLNCPPAEDVATSEYFRQKFNIEQSARIFLYQGGLSSGRGIEYILEVFKTINNPKYSVIFMGYGPLEENIKKTANSYKNVFFHPAVSPSEVHKLTSSADIGLCLIENSCLSYYFCLPNKLFEYIQAHLPVIATNLFELKRFIEVEKIGWLVEENNKNQLIDLIQNLSSEQTETFKENSKLCARKFIWENEEKKLLQLYSRYL